MNISEPQRHPQELQDNREFLRNLVVAKTQLKKLGKHESDEYQVLEWAILARLDDIEIHHGSGTRQLAESLVEKLQEGAIRILISDNLYANISAGDKLIDYVRNGRGMADCVELPLEFRVYVDALNLWFKEALVCYIELEVEKLKTVYTVKGTVTKQLRTSTENIRLYWLLDPGDRHVPADPLLQLPFVDPIMRVVDLYGPKRALHIGSKILVLRFGPLRYNYFNVDLEKTKPCDREVAEKMMDELAKLHEYLEGKSPIPEDLHLAWPAHRDHVARYPEKDAFRRKLAASCFAVEYLQNIQHLNWFPASAKLAVAEAWLLLYLVRPAGTLASDLDVDEAKHCLLRAVDDVSHQVHERANSQSREEDSERFSALESGVRIARKPS